MYRFDYVSYSVVARLCPSNAMKKKNKKFYIKVEDKKLIVRFFPSIGRAYRKGFRWGLFFVIGKELDFTRYY